MVLKVFERAPFEAHYPLKRRQTELATPALHKDSFNVAAAASPPDVRYQARLRHAVGVLNTVGTTPLVRPLALNKGQSPHHGHSPVGKKKLPARHSLAAHPAAKP